MIKEVAQVYTAWTLGKFIGCIVALYGALLAGGYLFEQISIKIGELSQKVSCFMGALFAALIILSLSAPAAHAGMTVSDPTSYIYYMQQMMQETESLANQAEQIEQMRKDYEQYTKMVDSMAGVLEYAGKTLDELKRMKGEIESNPSAALEYLQALFGNKQDREKYLDENGYVDTDKLLTENLGDINSSETDPFVEWIKRRKMQQTAIQKAIIDAEAVVQKRNEEIKNLEELVAQIKGDSPQQVSQVLTNHFLAEILRCLLEIKGLHARLVGMEGYFKFDGPTTPTSEEDSSEDPDILKINRTWETKVQKSLDNLNTQLIGG